MHMYNSITNSRIAFTYWNWSWLREWTSVTWTNYAWTHVAYICICVAYCRTDHSVHIGERSIHDGNLCHMIWWFHTASFITDSLQHLRKSSSWLITELTHSCRRPDSDLPNQIQPSTSECSNVDLPPHTSCLRPSWLFQGARMVTWLSVSATGTDPDLVSITPDPSNTPLNPPERQRSTGTDVPEDCPHYVHTHQFSKTR